MLQHVLDEAVDDQRHRFFLAQSALHAIEQHVFGNLRRRRLVLEQRRRVLGFDIRHGVRAALVADQQRIARGEVARARRLAMCGDEAAIGVLRHAGGDALRDDAAGRVLAQMDHLGAGIDLLVAVRNRDRIELAARIVAAQDAARILPGDRGAGFDLRPRNLGVLAAAIATLGDEVVDAALAFRVARIPVLHRRVFDLGVVMGDELYHGSMQLVLVALRSGAALEVRNVSALVGDDQRTLELAGVALVDAEIGRQLHRAFHARRHVNERAVGEYGRVQRRKIVVGGRHHSAEILLHQIGVFADRFRDRHEDHTGGLKFGLERRRDRHRIEHGIDGDTALAFRAHNAGQHLLLAQRNTELFVGLQNFRIDLVERGQRLLLRRGIVIEILVVDLWIIDACPGRFFHRQPASERLQTPLEHPRRFVLLGGDESDGVFGKPFRSLLGFNDGLESITILVDVDLANPINRLLYGRHFNPPLAVSRTAVDRLSCIRLEHTHCANVRTVQARLHGLYLIHLRAFSKPLDSDLCPLPCCPSPD